MIETKNDVHSQVSEVIWRALVSFCFGLSLIAFVSLLFKCPISGILMPLGMVLSLTFVALTQFDTSKKVIIAGLLFSVFLMFFSFKVSQPLLDLSADGRCYHYLAIHSIQAGWNPIHDPFPNSWPDYQINCARWSMLYPKGYYYAGAIIEKFFGNFEAAKSINLLWGISAFFLSFSKLRYARLKPVHKVLISAAIVLNPIAIVQWFTNYIDGQLYYCLVIVIILLISQIINIDKMDFIYMGFAVIYLTNLKFTGSIYLLIYLGAAILYVWIRSKKIKKTLPFVLTAVISIAVAIFLVGYNPYLTNYFKYQDPLYPWGIINKDPNLNQETIQLGNRPADFKQLNRFERFFRSVFSESDYEVSSSVLKTPFSIKLKEIIAFQAPDVRLGGFGPLFSGAVVVSGILLMIISVFFEDRRNITLLVTGVILISVFITDEGWWARYAPQFWLIPVFVLIPLFEKSDELAYQGLSLFLLSILLTNSYLTSVSNISRRVITSESTKSEISKIISNNREIAVKFNDMLSFEQLLSQNKIKYSVIDEGAELPCPTKNLYNVKYSRSRCKDQTP